MIPHKRLQDQLAAKTVSLNEEKRWQEYLADLKLGVSEEQKAEELEKNTRNRKKNAADPVLQEGAQIAADYYLLKNSSTPK